MFAPISSHLKLERNQISVGAVLNESHTWARPGGSKSVMVTGVAVCSLQPGCEEASDLPVNTGDSEAGHE